MAVKRKESFGDTVFKRDYKKAYSKGRFKENTVFVIMSFKQTKRIYEAIKEECSNLGLKATRVDENVGSDFVIKEIYKLIQSAEFIVCDITRQRPNVYYELGYAHGVGNLPLDILLVAKEGTILHFDIAPLRVQYYRSTDHLRSIITLNLKTMMKKRRRLKRTSNSSMQRRPRTTV